MFYRPVSSESRQSVVGLVSNAITVSHDRY